MRLFAVVAVVGVVMASTAASVWAQTAPFHLTLAPAFALLSADQHSVDFMLVNSNAEPVTIAVKASDAWVLPAEKSFTVAGNTSHQVSALIAQPAHADAGDHETDVLFTVVPAPGVADSGLIRISWGIASRVIIATGGTVVRDLHIFGLTVPAIADSWDVPTINLTLDNNHGNVHEVVDIAPFGQALVLRGTTRILSLPWSGHPFVGLGTVHAGNETATTLFIPWRVGGILLALLCGWLLVQRARKTPE